MGERLLREAKALAAKYDDPKYVLSVQYQDAEGCLHSYSPRMARIILDAAILRVATSSRDHHIPEAAALASRGGDEGLASNTYTLSGYHIIPETAALASIGGADDRSSGITISLPCVSPFPASFTLCVSCNSAAPINGCGANIATLSLGPFATIDLESMEHHDHVIGCKRKIIIEASPKPGLANESLINWVHDTNLLIRRNLHQSSQYREVLCTFLPCLWDSKFVDDIITYRCSQKGYKTLKKHPNPTLRPGDKLFDRFLNALEKEISSSTTLAGRIVTYLQYPNDNKDGEGPIQHVFHGTPSQNLVPILTDGLDPQKRRSGPFDWFSRDISMSIPYTGWSYQIQVPFGYVFQLLLFVVLNPLRVAGDTVKLSNTNYSLPIMSLECIRI